jgi:hypothetical protein
MSFGQAKLVAVGLPEAASEARSFNKVERLVTVVLSESRINIGEKKMAAKKKAAKKTTAKKKTTKKAAKKK